MKALIQTQSWIQGLYTIKTIKSVLLIGYDRIDLSLLLEIFFLQKTIIFSNFTEKLLTLHS